MFALLLALVLNSALAQDGDVRQENRRERREDRCHLRVEEAQVNVGGSYGYGGYGPGSYSGYGRGYGSYGYGGYGRGVPGGVSIRIGRDCEDQFYDPYQPYIPYSPAPRRDQPYYDGHGRGYTMPPPDTTGLTSAAMERYRLESETLREAEAVTQSARAQASAAEAAARDAEERAAAAEREAGETRSRLERAKEIGLQALDENDALRVENEELRQQVTEEQEEK